jgi:hypothetical protein
MEHPDASLENVVISKVIPDVWPDAALEKEMLRDCTEVAEGLDYFTDLQCHVPALLERVRDLEALLRKDEGYAREQSGNGSRLESGVAAGPTEQLPPDAWDSRHADGCRDGEGEATAGKEISNLREEIAVLEEQFKVACTRSQNWKNLCDKYKESSEANAEGLAVAKEKLRKANEFIDTVAWRAGCWSEQDTLANVADFRGITVAELKRQMDEAGK